MATANVGTRNVSAQELSPLTVALRIRPISEEVQNLFCFCVVLYCLDCIVIHVKPTFQEIDRGGSITAHAALDQTMVVLLDPSDDPDDILRQNRNREKQYVFDHVFDAIATQEQVYEKTTKGRLFDALVVCLVLQKLLSMANVPKGRSSPLFM